MLLPSQARGGGVRRAREGETRRRGDVRRPSSDLRRRSPHRRTSPLPGLVCDTSPRSRGEERLNARRRRHPRAHRLPLLRPRGAEPRTAAASTCSVRTAPGRPTSWRRSACSRRAAACARRASRELGRRPPGEAQGRPWAVSAASRATKARCSWGPASRRPARRGGWCGSTAKTVAPGRLAEHLRPLWLTPAQDRLFLEGAAERRRFFDRLVFAAEPIHAAHAGAYERALRERTRLLADEGRRSGLADGAGGPHGRGRRAGGRGARGDAAARCRPRSTRAAIVRFRKAELGLTGEFEKLALAAPKLAEIEARLAADLAASRPRDAAAGRALTGPHRGDLAVVHRRARPAGGRMLDRRAESADSEPGFGAGGATFTCEIAAESYIIAG